MHRIVLNMCDQKLHRHRPPSIYHLSSILKLVNLANYLVMGHKSLTGPPNILPLTLSFCEFS